MVNPLALRYQCSQLSEQDPHVITSLFIRTGTRPIPPVYAPAYLGYRGHPIGDACEYFFTPAVTVNVTQSDIDRLLQTEDEFLAASLSGASVGARGTGAVLIRTKGSEPAGLKVLSAKVTLADLAGSDNVTSYVPEGVPAAGPQTLWAVGDEGNIMVKWDDLSPGVIQTDLFNPCLIKVDVFYV